MKKDNECWMCGRTAKQVAKEVNDKDLDEDFILMQTGKVYACIICEGLITEVLENYLKEKFSRGE